MTLALLLLNPAAAWGQAEEFSIDWFQIGGGGGASGGDDFLLNGVVGLTAGGGVIQGGDFSITGGFGILQVLQSEGAPWLAIELGPAGTARVFWSFPAPGWSLSECADLSSGQWSPVPAPVQDDGRQHFVLVATGKGSRFLRLERARELVVSPVEPLAGAMATNVTFVAAAFSATVLPESLDSRWRVLAAGPDGLAGTVDDEEVKALKLVTGPEARSAQLTFETPLPDGAYLVIVGAGVAASDGSRTSKELRWTFTATNQTDTDADGLTDGFERRHGFDPTNPDENGNGVLDGLEDADGDGLSNRAELLLGLNPRDQFTFPPAPDAGLDRDGDRITDARELELGADWLKLDTDGDFYSDDAELLMGTDPANPGSRPTGFHVARPVEALSRQVTPAGGLGSSVIAGEVSLVTVLRWGRTFIAQPPVEGVGLSPGGAGRIPFGLARPAVEVFSPGLGSNAPPRFFLAQPPIEGRHD